MKVQPFAALLTLSLLASTATAGPLAMRPPDPRWASAMAPNAAPARAGSATLAEDERAELRAAEKNAPGLEDLRAGNVGVLGIVLIVVLVLILI